MTLILKSRLLRGKWFTQEIMSTPTFQITDAAVQAKLFNEYFHSVYTTSNYTLPPVDELPSPPNHIADVSISEEDVNRAFSSSRLRRDVPDSLETVRWFTLAPVTSLFTKCVKSSCLPMQWKIHKIHPVYKKGDKTKL